MITSRIAAGVVLSLMAFTPAHSVPPCDADNAGLTLPPGFCAGVVADGVGEPRHIAVSARGEVVAAMDGTGGVLILRDSDGDGRAEDRATIAEAAGTGIALHDGHLYFATDSKVLRWPWNAGGPAPSSDPEIIVEGLVDQRQHAAKSIAIAAEGTAAGSLFVNIGAPSNACQDPDRAPEVPGRDPCPLLARSGGIWRFDAKRAGQRHEDGSRFATGLRNTVALTVQPGTGELWGVTHGRDSLSVLWPKLYTPQQNAELVAEELVHLTEGDDFGWPYCFFDLALGKKILNPEYGGDGKEVGRCNQKKDPAVALPAHWAPIEIEFYTGSQFPPKYRGGAFVSFHGSWDRAPLPQAGYNVVFVPFQDGKATGAHEVFASGFGINPGGPHRPTGLAVAPDGSLYVADDRGGRIYRIQYARQ
ncbi:MAG TPA: PQQ-dependent sugar dehydrogenase [Candidatus Binatia bacterium]|nr:PQQ-dependent sugar dehydrogenase [Candidatus Binatia bacterium]